MRHCRQCRADAVGCSARIADRNSSSTLLPDEIDFDASERDAYRVEVERKRGAHHAAKKASADVLATAPTGRTLQVAVATKGDGRINQHFRPRQRISDLRGRPRRRRASLAIARLTIIYCQGGFGEDASLSSLVATLEGVDALLCAKIGGMSEGRTGRRRH